MQDSRFIRGGFGYSSWVERLSQGSTFKNWNLSRPKFPTRWSSNYGNLNGEENVDRESLEVTNGNVKGSIEPSKRGSSQTLTRNVNGRMGSMESSTRRPVRQRKLRHLILLGILIVLGLIIAVLVPILVIMVLPKGGTDENVSKVDIEVTIQNMQYTDAFADKGSQEYINFKDKFCSEIEKRYQTSELADSFDGCVVTDVRSGSLIVMFSVVFISRRLPLQSTVKSVLTSSRVTLDTGQVQIKLGVYNLEDAAIVIGQVTVIRKDENPIPRIKYNGTCRLDSSCITEQAECINRRCLCPSSRNHDDQKDHCFLYKSSPSTVSTTTPTMPSTLSTTISTKITSPTAATSKTMSLPQTASSSSETVSTSLITTKYSASSTKSPNTSSETAMSPTSTTILTTSTKTSTHTTTRKTTDSSGTISTEKATLPSTTIKTTSPSQIITSSPETIPMSLKTTKDSATPTVFQTTSSETAISSTYSSFPKVSKSHATAKGTTTSERSTLPIFSTTMLSKQSDKITASSALTTNPPATTKAVIATTTSQTQTGPKATKTTVISLTRTMEMSDSTKAMSTTTSAIIPSSSITTTSRVPTTKVIPTSSTQITTSSKRITSGSTKVVYPTKLTSDTLRSTGVTLPMTSYSASSAKVTDLDDLTRTTKAMTPETSSAISTQTPFQMTSSAHPSSTKILSSSAKTASSIYSTKSTDTTTPISIYTSSTRTTQKVAATSFSTGSAKTTISASLKAFPSLSGKTINPVTTRKNNATTNLLTTKAKLEFSSSVSPFTSSTISVPAKSTSPAPSAAPSSYSGSNTIQSFTSAPNGELKVVIPYLPPLNKLKIGEVEMIIFEVVDARNVAAIRLEQTTDSVQLISNITLSDGTMKKTYGPGRRSHMDVSVNRSEDQAVINVTLEFSPVHCNDAAAYKCKVTPVDMSSEAAETSVDIGVYKRPEKPHLTLSYDIVDEQEPWADRPSKCEGEVGNPAGYFVVEVLMSGSFADYTDWWPLDEQEEETDCGTYKTQTFVFYPNQTDYLNNKQIRCAVRNDNPIPDENLPVSEAKTVHVVQSDYCKGINWKFYKHPYECHAFVDCSIPGDMHFQLCGAQTCPNRETGCDVASCTTLCKREITKTTGKITTTTTTQLPLEDPYMRCNHTVEGNIDSTLIISCVLGNTDDSFMGNIMVYKDQDIFISGSGSEGTITADEQSATLTYTSSTIKLEIASLACHQAGTYTFVVNELLERSVMVVAKKRPEKPHLTLSYDIVDGQVPWGDRASKCEGEVGNPAGYFVVEVLTSGSFVNYTDWWPLNAQENETDCGTYKTQTFVFYSDTLDYLNGKKIRCAVRNDNPIPEENLPVSDAKTIHVVQSDYCEGIDWQVYEHPYECHAFIDCLTARPGNMHFKLCGFPNTCPNRETGCDVASCTTLCSREFTTATTTQLPLEDPYLRCNHTVEGNIDSTLIINCVLGNTDNSFVENITVFKDQDIFLSGNGNEGTITVDEQSATLTYTASAIKLEIASLACKQAGQYTFVVNELLERSVVVVATAYPEEPILTVGEFITNHQASIRCEGNLGYPKGTTDMQLQRKFAGNTKFMVMTEGVSVFEESDVLNCTTVKTLETKLIVTSDWNGAQLQCVTNANYAIFESAITTIDLQQQSVYIRLENPSAEIGKPFNITCEIVDVSELTSISFFRNNQLICKSVIDIVTSSEEDIVCTSKFNTSGGTLDISFLSVQCRGEGQYRCAPNSEASTAATVYLQVTREQHNNPSMISKPKTLIANTQMLYAESFICQGELDYPSGRRSVVLQTNKNGQFESYLNGERSTHTSRDECRITDTLVVKGQTFDTTWNDTQLRCAIEDNGEETNFVSEEYTLQLLPANYCEENPERSPHPLECHYHIWCTPALYVFDCSPLCPVVTNGNNTLCQPCSVPCH